MKIIRTALAAILALTTLASAALANDTIRFSTITQDPRARAILKEQTKGAEEWVKDIVFRGGVESPAKLIKVDGMDYIYAESCRPHMCSDYAVALLFGGDETTDDLVLYAFGREVKDGVIGPRPRQSIIGTFMTRTANR